MKKDPIVKQVRDIRRRMDRETQNDPDSFFQGLIKFQERFSSQLVRRKPKFIGPKKPGRAA